MTVVGIDLGTSNSLIGYWDGTAVQLIPNSLGSVLTPSVVGVDDDGGLVVGAVAKAWQYQGRDTAAEFKRQMGTAKTYRLGGHDYSPVELSALVLKALVADATRALGEPVQDAVISVPAYFNNQQREATIQAARLAGLTVQRLISEPTAAALAYGLHRTNAEQFLVLDLGGGTFDVSLLDMFEGVVQVKAIAGDNYLGGHDFTRALCQDFITNTLGVQSVEPAQWVKLYAQFDAVKQQLSTDETVTPTITLDETSYPLTIDRARFAALCAPLLARLQGPITRVMRDAGLTLSDIDRVLLVGGATRMPVVRQEVARLFRRLPDVSLEPDQVVAQGASLQTQLESDPALEAELIMTDVAAYTLGIETVAEDAKGQLIHDVFAPIIERNTPIPISITRTFTAAGRGRTIEFSVYQGENPQASANLHIGTLTLQSRHKVDAPLTVRFSYDVNGVLLVEAEDQTSGAKGELVITQDAQTLDQAAIDASLKKLEAFKVLPKDRAANQFLLAQLARAYEAHTGTVRATIQSAMVDFRSALDGQDPREIARTQQAVTAFLAQLDGDWS
ncbi:Hsp70 family protein [Lacticaseibacillus absianus]|uniref:Hsp70 family protein n=1 Tax=Lacticaseibacillus absianus TaxID=2729623 RepID=UPI0015CAB850|nr:Hsp70 family protein [Lacticaseibacillus absianus]